MAPVAPGRSHGEVSAVMSFPALMPPRSATRARVRVFTAFPGDL